MITQSLRKINFLLLIFAIALPLFSGCITSTVSPTPESVIKPTVTQKDPWEDLVVNADLIVSGNITDLRYDVVTSSRGGRFAYTIFTLAVDKVLKGDAGIKQVLIKMDGGKWTEVVDGKTQEVVQHSTGPYFSITDRALVCIQRGNDGVYSIPWGGLLWVDSSKGPRVISRTQREVMSRVIQIMKANNIPVALPASEIPPLPAEPVQRPK